MPPTLTPVTSARPVPLIVNTVPLVPLDGANALIKGSSVNPASESIPPGVVTVMAPDNPGPGIAVIVVEETTVKVPASSPPKRTEDAPVKLVPVIVIVVPAMAETGVKEVMAGGGIKTNPARLPFPVGVATTTFPEAPDPTVALITESETTVKAAAGTRRQN